MALCWGRFFPIQERVERGFSRLWKKEAEKPGESGIKLKPIQTGVIIQSWQAYATIFKSPKSLLQLKQKRYTMGELRKGEEPVWKTKGVKKASKVHAAFSLISFASSAYSSSNVITLKSYLWSFFEQMSCCSPQKVHKAILIVITSWTHVFEGKLYI